MTNKCSFENKELIERTTSVIDKFIKQKEIDLREKQEELENIPKRYKVTQIINKEINSLTEEIDSMKMLVKEIKCQ